jgi:WD40 repeat protein
LVNVWDESRINVQNAPTPTFTFDEHQSSVKAIEYVPFLGGPNCNMVATGGGINDHTVKIWNLATGELHSSLNTENKVSFEKRVSFYFPFAGFRYSLQQAISRDVRCASRAAEYRSILQLRHQKQIPADQRS